MKLSNKIREIKNGVYIKLPAEKIIKGITKEYHWEWGGDFCTHSYTAHFYNGDKCILDYQPNSKHILYADFIQLSLEFVGRQRL